MWKVCSGRKSPVKSLRKVKFLENKNKFPKMKILDSQPKYAPETLSTLGIISISRYCDIDRQPHMAAISCDKLCVR